MELFAAYDPARAKLITDRDTGRSKGFAFVTLNDAEQLNAAIEAINGFEFEGRELRVNASEPREARPAGSGAPRRPGGFGGDRRPGSFGGDRRSSGGGYGGGGGDRRSYGGGGGDRRGGGGGGDRRGGGGGYGGDRRSSGGGDSNWY